MEWTLEKRKAASVKAGEMCVVVKGTKGGDIGNVFLVYQVHTIGAC